MSVVVGAKQATARSATARNATDEAGTLRAVSAMGRTAGSQHLGVR